MAPVAVGPDGALYAATREGYLDVLEADGRLRFSVSLSGIAGGPLYVDARGSAFLATTTGLLVAVSAKGQRLFAYRPPMDVRGGVSYGTGVGLLVSSLDNIVLGVNRGGTPVFRFDSTSKLTLGPLALDGFCVVVTSGVVVHWLGQNAAHLTRVMPREVEAIAPGADGRLWVKAGDELLIWDKKRRLEHTESDVVAIATESSREPRGLGVVLKKSGELLWLGDGGKRVAGRQLPSQLATPVNSMALAGAAAWMTHEDGTIVVARPEGPLKIARLASDPLLPAVAKGGESAVIGLTDGRVFSLRRVTAR